VPDVQEMADAEIICSVADVSILIYIYIYTYIYVYIHICVHMHISGTWCRMRKRW